MRKLFMVLIVLTLATAAYAGIEGSLITFLPIEEGQPGSITNPISPSELIDIYITVDDYFFAMDVMVGFMGPAEIVSATGKAESGLFGWSLDPSNDPLFPVSNCVEMGLEAAFYPKDSGLAAKITLRALAAGQVFLSMGDGFSFAPSLDGYFRTPIVMGELIIYQAEVPEPATITLISLGILPAVLKRKRH